MLFRSPTYAEGGADFQQSLVLIRRINQHRLASASAAHDEHVVVNGSDHELVHFDLGVLPVQGGHTPILAPVPFERCRLGGAVWVPGWLRLADFARRPTV